jgi:hypothetical protein
LLVNAGMAHSKASVALDEELNWSSVATLVGFVSSIQPASSSTDEHPRPTINLAIFFIFYFRF